MGNLILFVTFLVITQVSTGMMGGGWQTQNVNDKSIKDLASKIVSKYNAESNDAHYHIPIEIKSAKTQIVAGTNTEIKLLIGKSNCLKNQVAAAKFDQKKCAEHKDKQRKEITAQVWEKPWENFTEIKFI